MNHTLWAVLFALAAAVSYACGVVVQQRAATTPNAHEASGPGLLQVWRVPLWWTGVSLDAAGFGLEFLALRAGTVSLVQPMLVSGLLFALPLGAAVSGMRVRWRDAGAAVLVVLGLATAVLLAAPAPGLRGTSARAWPLTVVVVAVLVTGLAVFAAVCRGSRARTASLAAAAAVVNGLLAAFGKAVAVRGEHGWVAAVLSWPAMGLVVTAILTLTLAAAAFTSGAPTAALAVLFAGEPAAGVVLGALLHGDSLRLNPTAAAGLLAALVACLSGVVLLARSPAVLASYGAPPPDGRADRTPGHGGVSPMIVPVGTGHRRALARHPG